MPAAATPIIGAVTGLGTMGMGIAQSISNGKQAKKLRDEIESYERQDLINPYEGLQVSTLAADRQREELARTMAGYNSAMQMGGSRAIASLASNLVEQQNNQNAQILANLDQQEAQRQQYIAQGNSMIQQMQEQREQQDLMGLGNAYNVALQNKNNGITTAAQGALGLANMATSGMFDDVFAYKPKTGLNLKPNGLILNNPMQIAAPTIPNIIPIV